MVSIHGTCNITDHFIYFIVLYNDLEISIVNSIACGYILYMPIRNVLS